MSEEEKPVGIRADDENRTQIRAELITNSLEGLVADLGSGFFVVTKDAANELTELGIAYTPVEIVKGVPSSVRKFIRETSKAKGVVPPF